MGRGSMAKLTSAQLACLDSALHANGKLVRHAGGFWSAEGVEMKSSAGQNIPVWHYGTQTIRALVKKGGFDVLEEKRNQQGSYAVAVRLTDQYSLKGGAHD